jgi:hypothetical protein
LAKAGLAMSGQRSHSAFGSDKQTFGKQRLSSIGTGRLLTCDIRQKLQYPGFKSTLMLSSSHIEAVLSE